MKPKVSVIIPNFNGEAYLNACVDSLMRQDVRSFEIIVVDDASTDCSMEVLQQKYKEQQKYPQIRYLKHEVNSGFCKSVNDGIQLAKGNYVILLNNDTVVDASFVRELYQAIQKSNKIFSVASKMVSYQNPKIMDDGGDYYCSLGWAYSLAKDKTAEKYTTKKRVFAACGGAAIYRRDLLITLGLFDENHFAYLEDIDIGYRAKLYGYVNLFTPKAVVYHVGSATSGSRYNDFKARLSARNSIYLLYKNMPNWQIIMNAPHLVIGFLVKLVFYNIKHMGHTYYTGLREGFDLCRSESGKSHRVQFSQLSFGRVCLIEIELLYNTIRRLIG